MGGNRPIITTQALERRVEATLAIIQGAEAELAEFKAHAADNDRSTRSMAYRQLARLHAQLGGHYRRLDEYEGALVARLNHHAEARK